MVYDRGDGFPFAFAPNGNQFDSKSKGKLSPRLYPIQIERKYKYSFSVYITLGKFLSKKNTDQN